MTVDRPRSRPLIRCQLVEGEALQLGAHTLTPVARVTSSMRRRATYGTRASGLWGWLLVSVRPVSIIVQRGQRRWRLPIHDHTALILAGMATVAVLLPLLSLLLIGLMQRRRAR